MLPRPVLFCLAIPTLALAGRLAPWELASAASAAMAIDAMLRHHPRRMLGWAGLALGAGVSGLVLLPLVGALLIARRVPARIWPILPAVAAALRLPDPLPPALLDGTSNVWALFPLDTLPMLGLACAATVGASAAYIAQFSVLARHASPSYLLRMALLAALVLPLLLPAMSDGAFFLAALLTLSLAWRLPDRDSIETAALVQGGVALGMFAPVAGMPAIGAILLITASLRTAHPLLRRAANDNPILARHRRTIHPSIPA